MDILFLLVPMSVVLALLVIALFAWALNASQFDDVEPEGERILWDEVPAPRAGLDLDQAGHAAVREESRRLTRGIP